MLVEFIMTFKEASSVSSKDLLEFAEICNAFSYENPCIDVIDMAMNFRPRAF